MTDTRFEREKPALEQMPLPIKSRVRVIDGARFMIERHSTRLDAAEASETSRQVSFNVLAQVQQDESNAVRILNNLNDQPSNVEDMPSAKPMTMSDDMDSVRRLVEESYEAA